MTMWQTTFQLVDYSSMRYMDYTNHAAYGITPTNRYGLTAVSDMPQIVPRQTCKEVETVRLLSDYLRDTIPSDLPSSRIHTLNPDLCCLVYSFSLYEPNTAIGPSVLLISPLSFPVLSNNPLIV